MASRVADGQLVGYNNKENEYLVGYNNMENECSSVQTKGEMSQKMK
jgi:hypothetical protein